MNLQTSHSVCDDRSVGQQLKTKFGGFGLKLLNLIIFNLFFCVCENISYPVADSGFPLLPWRRNFEFFDFLDLASDCNKPGRWMSSSPVNAPLLPRRQRPILAAQAKDARGGGRRRTHVTFLTASTPLATSLPSSIHCGRPLTSFRLNSKTLPCRHILKVLNMCMSNAMNMDVTSFFGAPPLLSSPPASQTAAPFNERLKTQKHIKEMTCARTHKHKRPGLWDSVVSSPCWPFTICFT